jgi:hypothetical protein
MRTPQIVIGKAVFLLIPTVQRVLHAACRLLQAAMQRLDRLAFTLAKQLLEDAAGRDDPPCTRRAPGCARRPGETSRHA